MTAGSSIDPLRVLHVTSGLGLGGAETMLYRLLRSLRGRDEQRHSVLALTSGNCFDFASIGVPVQSVDLRARRFLATALALRRTIRAFRPDLVQGWMYHGNITATLFAPSGVPVAWGIHHSLHDLRGDKKATRLLIHFGALLARLPRTRRIVYVSDTSRRHHADFGYPDQKAIVISNGFDCDDFSPDEAQRVLTRRALGVTPDQLLVGSFGRVHPVKDHPTLLRAFARVSAALPNARLVLAGHGATESNGALVEAIESNGLTGRVKLLGARSDMPSLYRALDLYVLSSKSESFPNVLGEASATGVPCVTTAVGDARRIVGPTGRVVPPADAEALALVMREVLELTASDRRSLGEAARAHVVASFGLKAVGTEYSGLYERLATRRM